MLCTEMGIVFFEQTNFSWMMVSLKKKMNDGRETWNVLINKTTLFFWNKRKGCTFDYEVFHLMPILLLTIFYYSEYIPQYCIMQQKGMVWGGVYLMWTADVIILVKIVNINNINNISSTCVGCVILMSLCTWLVLRR